MIVIDRFKLIRFFLILIPFTRVINFGIVINLFNYKSCHLQDLFCYKNILYSLFQFNVNTNYFLLEYNVSAFCAEVTIPLISDELKPECSIWLRPDIVQPCGVVTLSTSLSG